MTVIVLTVHEEMGEALLADLCPQGPSGLTGETEVEGTPVKLEVLAGDPRLSSDWDSRVDSADGLVLLVRFLDVISVDKIRAIYRRLPSEKAVPLAVFIQREEGEIDFKISCPVCGQKLWVRDTDVNKRGRCPNCKKAFRLPSQSQHLKVQLMLPDSIPIFTVVRGNPATSRGALANLAARAAGKIAVGAQPDVETLKKATVRVQLPNES
ncbi:MAG TPA: hypothetical protein EYP62_04260 [Kiritimatiellae bacterium]|nr:hypothetical protein [Kiritimatiellia bacterium]